MTYEKDWNKVERKLKEGDIWDRQFTPDKESEELLIKPSQLRLKLQELYWRIRAYIADWIGYLRAK